MGQEEVLKYIEQCGRAVTVVELMKQFRTTQPSMARIVRQLQKYRMIRVTLVHQRKIITRRDRNECV